MLLQIGFELVVVPFVVEHLQEPVALAVLVLLIPLQQLQQQGQPRTHQLFDDACLLHVVVGFVGRSLLLVFSL